MQDLLPTYIFALSRIFRVGSSYLNYLNTYQASLLFTVTNPKNNRSDCSGPIDVFDDETPEALRKFTC